jgi:NADH dehydrogenase
MELLLAEIGRQRLLVPMPFFAARLIASVAQFMPKPLLTPDQLILLKSDNLVGDEARGFAELGLSPTPIAALLPDYLWRFRPSGKKPATG